MTEAASDPARLPDEVLSIGDLARATGVSVETLRMWERRYGRPASIRLPSGHRRYTPDQARWLRRVAEAVAHGHRASEAVRASDVELTRLLATAPAAPQFDVDPWLALARDFDADAVRGRLRAEIASRTACGFVSDLVAPLLHALGRAWADGRVDVRHEHFLSTLVSEDLRALRERAKPAADAPRVLFTTLPGERHGLGIEMASAVAAHAGARCVLLGPDTPIGEISAAARELDADAVALSVSVAHGGVDADRQIAEIRRDLSPWVRLIAGGAGTRRPRRGPKGIEYVEDFAEFGRVVASLRRERPR